MRSRLFAISSRLFGISYGLTRNHHVVKKQCPISWNLRKANYCTTSTTSKAKEAFYSKIGIYALGFFTPVSVSLLRDYKTQESGVLKSPASAAAARLAAVREQVQSAQEEADEWKRKYADAVGEANTNMQSREDALRAEFAQSLTKKDGEVREKAAKIEQAERRLATLTSKLKTAESKVESYYSEMPVLKYDVRNLTEKLESYKSEARMLEQEKSHLEQKYWSEFARFDEGQKRCKAAEKEVKRATEAADKARSEATVAQKEKNEIQRASMERLTQIEQCERQIDNLVKEKNNLAGQIDALRNSANSKTRQIDNLVKEKNNLAGQIDALRNSANSKTRHLEVQVETERVARVEANSRAEALSHQLQATQGKLDMVQQQLSSVQSALDAKLKTQGKRSRVDEHAKLKID